jgi:hypothetical protein
VGAGVDSDKTTFRYQSDLSALAIITNQHVNNQVATYSCRNPVWRA